MSDVQYNKIDNNVLQTFFIQFTFFPPIQAAYTASLVVIVVL